MGFYKCVQGYCDLCYNLVITCIFGVLYLVSHDDGSPQPKHVVEIKSCAIFTHERVVANEERDYRVLSIELVS
jgi:hypothetical protein